MCFIFVLYFVSQKKAGLVIPQLFFIVISVVNYYLISFRGRSICFSDVRSIKTVLNVTRQYNLTVDREIVLQAEECVVKKSKTYKDTMNLIQDKHNEEMTNSESPDVIVIMNESFSDLSVINSFNTNKDYMPFFHSLNENCVKGNL